MRYAFAWLGGVLLGLIVSVPARRAAIYYSEYSLPPEYVGPKVRVWRGGELTFSEN